ncbi:MAG: ribonuclease P protein component [Burkholderiaceae bacterium]
MIDRVTRSVDFERVLRTPSHARTAHFALHHLAQAPAARLRGPAGTELSTAGDESGPASVDDLTAAGLATALPERRWWGAVVPKRHARRAVTRTLIKRQIRVCAEHAGAELAAGLWVVRLRAPFDRLAFPSAASDALKAAARSELRTLIGRAARA